MCVDWGLIYLGFLLIIYFILRTDWSIMLDIAETEKSIHLLGIDRLKLYDCCCLCGYGGYGDDEE